MANELNWEVVADELKEALDGIVPVRNCTCHIAPPCRQCEEFGQAYDALEYYKREKKKSSTGSSVG